MNVWRQRRSARSSPSQRARISKSCARAFSVSIESKRGSRFLILTRFLNANRVHFAGKRSSAHAPQDLVASICGLGTIAPADPSLFLPLFPLLPLHEFFKQGLGLFLRFFSR